jgi:GGDEF domain-containing protein
LDYAGALTSFRRFHEVTTRIFDDERSRRLEQLDRRYQAEHREAELARLRAEQAHAALQLSEQTVLRNSLLAAAAVVTLSGIALYRRRIESSRLAERLSVTDPLTGLKNRRYVWQTIERDVSEAVRRYRASDEPAPTCCSW